MSVGIINLYASFTPRYGRGTWSLMAFWSRPGARKGTSGTMLCLPLHVHAQEGEHRVQHGCARHKTAIVGVLREPRVLE